ncbi:MULTISPECIES: GGDEF domain-containing phosphodiesterase [Lysinibacillus]|uniref:GGDEF domain-containing phosphodiesterase n=1 Tax=Lysinibacillus TaxID=400634 RepID=UPI001C8CCD64|nr:MULTISPECIES: GGDEF domain-containing phosphodiesterase [Lysinibacillus]WHP40158.1 EAL domain-containing protein [Lysinibacillus boronitolerans]MBX8942407.1 EAL domain-containing protein [Lysinibacillus sp. K60]UNT55230.1 EAL domain-containing protein [Lysinibacillus capsici]UUV24889.1 EAL domain-containing protein [Lysinibacillus sp. FN11]UYB47759.1 EAL domain-containing protein [Lysinibacillus capsici]
MSHMHKSFTIDEHYLNSLPFPAIIINQDGQATVWGKNAEHLIGLLANDIKGNTTPSIHENLLRQLPVETFQSILQNEDSTYLEKIQVHTTSNVEITTALLAKPFTDEGERFILLIFMLPELMTQAISQCNTFVNLKQGLDATFMTVTLDHDGFILECNNEFLKTSQWTPKRVIGKTFWQLFPDNEVSEKITHTIWRNLNNGHTWQGEVEKITKTGQSYWVLLTAIPLVNLETNEQQFILIEKDVTKSKTIQHQLEKIAYIDTETGLMNAHRLEKVITNMIDDERHFSFVYLSIDKFYTLKELHDQQIDQSLIVEFTNRIKMYFQDSTMARINENDFVVITPLSEWFIQGFLSYLQQHPIYSDNIAVPISISGGITRYPEDQSTFSQLMKASIATISTVREAGGDKIVSLSTATHKALNRKALIEKRLLQALDQKNLKVLYQPQIDVYSGKVTAVEALVRWEDEVIGVVTPDELIPIAEETGLINNIGSFMLEKACEQALLWKKAGYDLKVSINSSVREFRDKNMAKSILEMITKTGCPANLLQIEITEKFALEAEAATSIAQQMRKLENEGISFVLDDFGTGYGSFRYMQILPISTLKIDQTFTNSLLKSEKSQKLMNGMVQLGKSMELKVVAEGVETAEQADLLITYGCDAIQGYYISKPVTPEEIELLLTKQ